MKLQGILNWISLGFQINKPENDFGNLGKNDLTLTFVDNEIDKKHDLIHCNG